MPTPDFLEARYEYDAIFAHTSPDGELLIPERGGWRTVEAPTYDAVNELDIPYPEQVLHLHFLQRATIRIKHPTQALTDYPRPWLPDGEEIIHGVVSDGTEYHVAVGLTDGRIQFSPLRAVVRSGHVPNYTAERVRPVINHRSARQDPVVLSLSMLLLHAETDSSSS